MSITCREFFEKISRTSGIPLFVYEPEGKVMRRYCDGVSDIIPVPGAIRPSLERDDIIVGFYSSKGDPVVIYFLRAVIGGVKCVCVVKDAKTRKNLNAFFGAYAAFCREAAQNYAVFPENFQETVTGGETPGRLKALEAEVYEKEARIKDLESTLSVIGSIKEEGKRDKEKISEMAAIIERRDEEIAELRNLLDGKGAEASELKSKMAEMDFELQESKKLAAVLCKSRDKMRVLIDGVSTPLYSVSPDYTILHANNATASFAGAANVASIVGKKCYEVLFGKTRPCPWCRMAEVLRTGETFTMKINMEKGGRPKTIDLYAFPISDQAGEITDFGSILVDKTEVIEMEASMTRVKEQLKTFKKSKISDMNELQELKKDYADLSLNYTALLGRNVKMTKTLETLMAKDSTKEILAAKTELQEYKNKLARSYDAIKNYQRNIESLQLKYSDLNKRTFFQMERLINVMNSRYGASDTEVASAIDLLNRNIEEIKKNGSLEGPVPPSVENGGTGENS